ncbi:MAG: PaaI family thioesterase [Bradymonadia bacterium]
MAADWTPADPDYATRVQQSFERQIFMQTLGAELGVVKPGYVEITLPFQEALTQQHGFLHAGAVTSVVDSACGYAALTLMPAGAAVLSVEFKVNLLAPAKGEFMIAEGRVKKAGRTLMVCTGDVWAVEGDTRKNVTTMTATMMVVEGRGLSD